MAVKTNQNKQKGNGDRRENRLTDQQIKSSLDLNKSTADKVAIFISDTFGSIKFLCICVLFFIIWIVWNLNLLPWVKPFDKYPFAVLDMVVSIFAIILSVSVLISQNRQGRLEKSRQHVEFEVNVRAESEITKVLAMLHEIQIKMGIDRHDAELEEMKEDLSLEQLQKRLNEEEL